MAYKPRQMADVPTDSLQRSGFQPMNKQTHLMVTPALNLAQHLRIMVRVHQIQDIPPKKLLEAVRQYEDVNDHPDGFKRIRDLETENLAKAENVLFDHRKLPCSGVNPDGEKCNRPCIRNKLYCSHCMQYLEPEITDTPKSLQLSALQGPFVSLSKTIRYPLPLQPGLTQLRSPMNFATLEIELNQQIELLADILTSFQQICKELRRNLLDGFPEHRLVMRFGPIPSEFQKSWQHLYETVLKEVHLKSLPMDTNWAQWAYRLKALLIPTAFVKFSKPNGNGVCDAAAAEARGCSMFKWTVPKQVLNPDTQDRHVLFDAFRYDTMLGLDTATDNYVAKVPLRESGEDDSQLFVMEPERDGVKDHHAVLRLYMTMPLTKMFMHNQRGKHLGQNTDAGRRRDQADYGQIHLQFLGMFKVDNDDEAAAFCAEASDFTFADGRRFSKQRIDKLLNDHAKNPTRLWQFRDKKRELEELLEGRRKNGKTTRVFVRKL